MELPFINSIEECLLHGLLEKEIQCIFSNFPGAKYYNICPCLHRKIKIYLKANLQLLQGQYMHYVFDRI